MKIFLSVILVLSLVLSFSFTVDESAMKLQEEAMNRAMIAFGLAKGLNAVISLLQGTELSFTPVGIGLSFSVGEVLDPFNDMVERFSWVMLGASVSLGVQKLLLVLSSKLFLQVALGLSVIVSFSLLWIRKLHTPKLFIFSLKLFALLLLLRFSAILFIYSSELLYTSTLQSQYNNATLVIEKTKIKLEELENKNRVVVATQKESSFFSGVSSKYTQVIDNLNISKQLASLENTIEEASQNMITLITIFITQSLLMPLLFLWFSIFSIKFIFRIEFNEEKLKLLYNH